MSLGLRTVLVGVGGLVFAFVLTSLGFGKHAPADPPQRETGIAGISAADARDPANIQAYMHAHPVPPVPGMTAGIITSYTDLGDLCHQRTQVHTAAVLKPAVGDDVCDAWAFTVLTPSGRTVRVTCGGPGFTCPPGHIVTPGSEGEYLYVPASGGRIRSEGDIDFLSCDAGLSYPCPWTAAVYP